MTLFGVVSLGIVLLAALAGSPLVAAFLYLLSGVVWVRHESRRPVVRRPIGYQSGLGTALLLLMWPGRLVASARESGRIRRSGERFAVATTSAVVGRFGTWDEAVKVAGAAARQNGEKATLLDQSRFGTHMGRLFYKSWWVSPDGVVSTIPRRSPFGLSID